MKRYKGSDRAGKVHSRRGFTLTQILVVMAVISILSALILGVFGRSRQTAQRAQCDMQLKAVVMALDAFRQENGHYPGNLQELVAKKYLTDASMLHCPSDPRPNGTYDDFYVMRNNRDSGELPIVVCPLCANKGEVGLQAFKGRYTKQFATRPGEITLASGATVERPGKNPIAARAGMFLRGGDTIRTAAGGSANIRFADGSVSELSGGSDITLLQSFIAGHTHAPLYTLIRQKLGDVTYHVHHGSKFDVSTPTATAGALGTEFRIRRDTNEKWWLMVTESKVMVSNPKDRVIVTPSATIADNMRQTNDKNLSGTPVAQTVNWVDLGKESAQSSTDTPITSSNDSKWWQKWKDLFDKLFGH